MKALIDGDILAYQASSSVQKDIDWGDGLWTCHAFLSDAIAQFEDTLDSIVATAEARGFEIDNKIFGFTDKDNFRKIIDPNYKASRKNNRKPTCYNALVAYIKKKYLTMTLPMLEGDDVLGILATSPEFKDDNVILSMDKDFKTIPTLYYDFGRDRVHNIDSERAMYWHMMQTLTGDTTDGYKGCPTYGPKKAERLLKSLKPEEYWDAVVEAFKEQGLTEADALKQAQLAYILHYDTYEYEPETGLIHLKGFKY